MFISMIYTIQRWKMQDILIPGIDMLQSFLGEYVTKYKVYCILARKP